MLTGPYNLYTNKDMVRWVACGCNSSYSFIPNFLKLCSCFHHGLKICMCFWDYPLIIFMLPKTRAYSRCFVFPSLQPYILQVHTEVSVCMGICLFHHCGVKNWFVGLKIDKNVCCGIKEDQRKIKGITS